MLGCGLSTMWKGADVLLVAVPLWASLGCGLGVLLGLVSKSAMIGLHSWLLDAMEGPTPVSALLHSATLVCAGVVLTARLLPVLCGAFGLSTWLLGLGCASVLLAA